jgi:hypothetical protein
MNKESELILYLATLKIKIKRVLKGVRTAFRKTIDRELFTEGINETNKEILKNIQELLEPGNLNTYREIEYQINSFDRTDTSLTPMCIRLLNGF